MIGYPLSHSVSPQIHAELFRLSHVRGSYVKEEIPPQELTDSMDRLRRLSGFNVTVPHKVNILPFLDALDESAQRYGSVNTVLCEDGRQTGFNTDCNGFLRSLADAGIPLRGRVCVIGAGGVGRMFAMESALSGCEVTVAARKASLHKAQALCAEIAARVPGAKLHACDTALLSGGWDLLINASPSGMFPNTDEAPVGEAALKGSAALFESIYNPRQTKLMQMAQAHCQAILGGASMLVWQAAKAQEIWTGAVFTASEIASVTAMVEGFLSPASGG